MTISWLQAALLGLFACLSSMPGLGGTSFGNYTLGRPLIGGLVCGIILGDIKTGILVGAAMQVVYIYQLPQKKEQLLQLHLEQWLVL